MTSSFFSDFLGPFPDVLWSSDFLSTDEHAELFRFCRDEIAWQSKGVPRLLAWFGDVSYQYSGIHHPAREMPAPLQVLRARIEAYLHSQGVERSLNSVLLNYYRDGRDSIGMHSDDESQLEPESVIASVSLGASRTFVFRNKQTRVTHRNELPGGSLLVMKGDCQKVWTHGIPKEPSAGPRINLTFRQTFPVRHD